MRHALAFVFCSAFLLGCGSSTTTRELEEDAAPAVDTATPQIVPQDAGGDANGAAVVDSAMIGSDAVSLPPIELEVEIQGDLGNQNSMIVAGYGTEVTFRSMSRTIVISRLPFRSEGLSADDPIVGSRGTRYIRQIRLSDDTLFDASHSDGSTMDYDRQTTIAGPLQLAPSLPNGSWMSGSMEFDRDIIVSPGTPRQLWIRIEFCDETWTRCDLTLAQEDAPGEFATQDHWYSLTLGDASSMFRDGDLHDLDTGENIPVETVVTRQINNLAEGPITGRNQPVRGGIIERTPNPH